MTTRINGDVQVDGNVTLTGAGLFRWDAGDWSKLTQLQITAPGGGNTYTKTTPGYGTGTQGLQRGRLTTASGADGNERLVFLWPEYRLNSRLGVEWYDKSIKSVGDTQIGHCLGVKLGADGLYYGYIVRHDIAFGQDSLVQVGLWRWNPTTLALTILSDAAPAVGGLTGIKRLLAATATRDAGNVVTATIRDAGGNPMGGHGIAVGHSLSVDMANNTYDGTVVVTGTPTATTITWAGSGGADAGTTGTIDDLDGVLPLVVDSVLEGTTCYVRARRKDQPEPSWSDPAYSITLRAAGLDPYPNQPGRQGLYAGHPAPAGTFYEWGVIDRSYDNG